MSTQKECNTDIVELPLIDTQDAFGCHMKIKFDKSRSHFAVIELDGIYNPINPSAPPPKPIRCILLLNNLKWLIGLPYDEACRIVFNERPNVGTPDNNPMPNQSEDPS